MHPKYIQAQFGHASVVTTLDPYSHLMPEGNQEAAKGLKAVLFGRASQAGDGSRNKKGLQCAL